ncbi:hypothetical protein JKG47_20810 [Acidithiobacillus sp. MC6.1]|nr:hypothetical protein [Acidithiobacillus sp. MC6.1]
MGASDFRPPPPLSSLLRLVQRCATAPVAGSPWLPPTLIVKLDADLDPGVASTARQCAGEAVACWAQKTIGQHTNAVISGLHPSGSA